MNWRKQSWICLLITGCILPWTVDQNQKHRIPSNPMKNPVACKASLESCLLFSPYISCPLTVWISQLACQRRDQRRDGTCLVGTVDKEKEALVCCFGTAREEISASQHWWCFRITPYQSIAPFDYRRVTLQKTGITPNKNRNVEYQHWDKTNKNEDIELCI